MNYQEVEDKIYNIFKREEGCEIDLPNSIKEALNLHSTKVLSVDNEISKKPESKTDVLVVFDDGGKLKISIKKENADYYGNWYTHQRIKEEFGSDALDRLIEKTTQWANQWIQEPSSSFFLGVSINFGRRSGKTFMNFHDVFSNRDIKSIVQGYNTKLDTSANILLKTNGEISNITDIIELLEIIDDDLLKSLFSDIKIIFRPINPMTERSNRGKQIYTKFVPYEKFSNEAYITTKDELQKYGSYKPIDLVKEYKLNHNQLIKTLQKEYNILIKVK